MLTPEVREKLGANTALALHAYGHVLDQKSSRLAKYSSKAITRRLQDTTISYFDNPPLTEHGQTSWLVQLGYRQAGKSLTPELCAYVKAAYSPHWDHACIADKKERANYLHERVHVCHEHWPVEVRAATAASRERRQLTFAPPGGKMRTLSAHAGAVGIGQSPDSFHGSELPFWAELGPSLNLIIPSMINRDASLAIYESTPAPADAPSVEAWREMCGSARRRQGRFVYAFFPFWDGKLNARPWKKTWTPTLEELQLYEKYHTQGLSWDNLAFRRLMMDTDDEIRRNPDLFKVFYPFDDVTCWQAVRGGVIHGKALDRHQKSVLVPWSPPYMEYEAPQEGAIYVLGGDPAGFAARDHAAFHVLKVFDGEWTQVASFADHVDPVAFGNRVLATATRYNNAKVVLEANGVGAGAIAMMLSAGYKNLHHEKPFKPGITVTGANVDKMLGHMIDALLDELVLRDADTVDQLSTYRNDKRVEDGATAEMLRGAIGRNRRERHHWDKVSALGMAIQGARMMPRRRQKVEVPQTNVIPFSHRSASEQQTYFDEEATRQKKSLGAKPRLRYKSVRRRRPKTRRR